MAAGGARRKKHYTGTKPSRYRMVRKNRFGNSIPGNWKRAVVHLADGMIRRIMESENLGRAQARRELAEGGFFAARSFEKDGNAFMFRYSFATRKFEIRDDGPTARVTGRRSQGRKKVVKKAKKGKK